MIKSWYDEVKEDFVKNINDTYTLNLAVSILEDRQNLLDETLKCKEVINKAIELLGNYKHYSTPDEEQNSDNEDLVNKAFDILKEVEHE